MGAVNSRGKRTVLWPASRVLWVLLACLACQFSYAQDSEISSEIRSEIRSISACFTVPDWAHEEPGDNRAYFMLPSYGAEEMLKALGQQEDPLPTLIEFAKSDCDYRRGIGAFALAYIWDIRSVQFTEDGIFAGNSPKEQRTAFEFYKMAADAGHVEAQATVCHRLLDGEGTPKNFLHAKEYCEAAAGRGDKLGYLGLGQIYINGHGVPPNPVEAYKWYLLADGSGNELWQLSVNNQIEKLEGMLSVTQINQAQQSASTIFENLAN